MTWKVVTASKIVSDEALTENMIFGVMCMYMYALNIYVKYLLLIH